MLANRAADPRRCTASELPLEPGSSEEVADLFETEYGLRVAIAYSTQSMLWQDAAYHLRCIVPAMLPVLVHLLHWCA